ncbi:unnamed protein product, partial [Rotaria sp. Silwood2]
MHPGVILSSKTLQKNDDPTQSQQLTIQNLLKRVEELQLMDPEHQKCIETKVEILDNQQERDTFEIVSTSNSLFLPPETEQQIEQNNKSEIDNEFIQREDIITRESVQNLYSNFSCMPPCSERSILRLMYLLSLKLGNELIVAEDNTVILNCIESNILEEWKVVKGFLMIEELESSQIQELITAIEENVNDQNWKTALSTLERVLKAIRPLNVQELSRLVQKANEAAQKTKGQDIIFLVGKTGAGKSTMIHFLAGSKFAEIKLKGMSHIHPTVIKNRNLEKITTAPFARSETRYITPVRVFFKDIDGSTNDSVLLCDGPGFMDTNGPEVDIANHVGIIKAIKEYIDQTKYKTICQHLAQQCQILIDSFHSSVLSDKFDESTSIIKKLHEALHGLEDYLDCTDITDKCYEMKKDFLHCLENSVGKSNSIL